MPSLRSKLLVVILRVIGVKRDLNRLEQRVANKERTKTEPTRRQRRKYAISTRELKGHKIWTIAPHENTSGKYLIYLHGGAYVNSFAAQHWGFMSKLVQRLNCTIVAPDYPHAPEYFVHDTSDLVLQVYRETIAAAGGSSKVYLMGDSSGGGIALALAQRLREEGIGQPGYIVLLSPWLDATLSNPEIPAIDKIDPFLGVVGMKWSGRAYAHNLDPTNYLVSPVYGSLQGLAPISVFIGTRDILLPDCRKLQARALAEGVVLDYHEYDGMVHNWMLVPLPESKRVLNTIVERLSHG
ncbi:MAG: alpha/beta hydrolase [Pyrinomonadaceae bacterium]